MFATLKRWRSTSPEPAPREEVRHIVNRFHHTLSMHFDFARTLHMRITDTNTGTTWSHHFVQSHFAEDMENVVQNLSDVFKDKQKIKQRCKLFFHGKWCYLTVDDGANLPSFVLKKIAHVRYNPHLLQSTSSFIRATTLDEELERKKSKFLQRPLLPVTPPPAGSGIYKKRRSKSKKTRSKSKPKFKTPAPPPRRQKKVPQTSIPPPNGLNPPMLKMEDVASSMIPRDTDQVRDIVDAESVQDEREGKLTNIYDDYVGKFGEILRNTDDFVSFINGRGVDGMDKRVIGRFVLEAQTDKVVKGEV